MSTVNTTYDDQALGGEAIERHARGLLGQVIGLVAVAVGFAALGDYLGGEQPPAAPSSSPPASSWTSSTSSCSSSSCSAAGGISP
jgi:hypothetical protein